MTLEKLPKTLTTTTAPLHPDYPKRGTRTFTLTNEFYLDDDLEKNKVYRLMHLCNFKDNIYLSTDVDQTLEAKPIHWLPATKDLIKLKIRMDNGSDLHGYGEKNLEHVHEGDIIQFERQFFVRLDKKEKDCYSFWFTHR